MRILSANVNGIRAALKKGFQAAIQDLDPDVLLLQEVKGELAHLQPLMDLGYHAAMMPAEKKGYSGVAILSKTAPTEWVYGCGVSEWDAEGRVITAYFDGHPLAKGTPTGRLGVMSLYLPSGTSGDERQQAKYRMLDFFKPHAESLMAKNPAMVIGGDFNICHREIDIHNPKGNAKNSGFLPEERAWMDTLLSADGGQDGRYLDSFRHMHPTEAHAYTWWSQRFPTVRAENKGWRIDYLLVSPALAPALEAATHHPTPQISDHGMLSIALGER